MTDPTSREARPTKHRSDVRLHSLLTGIPGTSKRGFLGWSSVTLLQTGGRHIIVDPGGIADRPGVLNALVEHGLAPQQIDTVVLTHLHFDHVANVELFPQAMVVLHEAEIGYALGAGLDDLGNSAWLNEAVLGRPRLEVVAADEQDLAPGVSALHTPGHTGGSMTVLATVGDDLVAVTGDTVKTRYDVARGFGDRPFDQQASRASVATVLDLADVLIPGHDSALRVSTEDVRPLWPVESPLVLDAGTDELVHRPATATPDGGR